jgi:hypothetical protein
MKTIRVLGLAACVLLLCGVANARVVTVRSVVDYRDDDLPENITWNDYNEPEGYFFIPPGETLDHSPYYRLSLEDWGWKHRLAGVAPADANGIRGALLSIVAWDVDTVETEKDMIYANNRQLGLLQGLEREWTTTSFALSADVLAEILRDKELNVFMDIDKSNLGHRVTLGSSILDVSYTVPGAAAEPNATVYRFWSPVLSGHFYTIKESERDMLLAQYPDVWTYEGPVYRVFGALNDGGLKAVYRFWSELLSAHFYTISEAERDYLLNNYANAWTYEGPVFYAYAEGQQPVGTKPVYRFWSAQLSKHFYTISEAEKQYILQTYPTDVWGLEGIAWYAYELPVQSQQ